MKMQRCVAVAAAAIGVGACVPALAAAQVSVSGGTSAQVGARLACAFSAGYNLTPSGQPTSPDPGLTSSTWPYTGSGSGTCAGGDVTGSVTDYSDAGSATQLGASAWLPLCAYDTHATDLTLNGAAKIAVYSGGAYADTLTVSYTMVSSQSAGAVISGTARSQAHPNDAVSVSGAGQVLLNNRSMCPTMSFSYGGTLEIQY